MFVAQIAEYVICDVGVTTIETPVCPSDQRITPSQFAAVSVTEPPSQTTVDEAEIVGHDADSFAVPLAFLLAGQRVIVGVAVPIVLLAGGLFVLGF